MAHHDQLGREVKVGDAVTMTGTVESLTEDVGVNAVVLLDQTMPPTGAQSRVHLNSVQVTLVNPPEPAAESKPAPPTHHEGEHHNPPPLHEAGKKK